MHVWEQMIARFWKHPIHNPQSKITSSVAFGSCQNMKPYFVVLALVGLVLPGAALAQGSFRFEHLGAQEGLSQSVVTGIMQDRAGYLWFATEEGLNRYDGYQFTVYRHDLTDSTTIASSRVGSVFEDRDGTVWVGTHVGLDRFDRATETFEHVWHHDDAYLSIIVQDTTGMLWIGTAGSGLYRMDPQTHAVERISLIDGSAHVHALIQTQRGDIWVGYPLFCKLNILDATCRAPALDADLQGYTLMEDEQGRIWLAARSHQGVSGGVNSLLVWDEQDAWVEHMPLPGPLNSSFEAIMRDGYVWLGVSDGLLVVDPARKRSYRVRPDPNVPSGLRGHLVKSVYGDRQGTVWVGTERGINRWRRPDQPFTLYRREVGQRDGLSDNRVIRIIEDRDGYLWIATNDGLNRLDRRTGTFTHYEQDTARRPLINAIWQVFEDRQGTLWIGTKRDGLFLNADGGTLFLDEIAQMPDIVQVALLPHLRVVEGLEPDGSHNVCFMLA